MPISTDEFESGTVEGGPDSEDAPIEEEKRLIVSFLSERRDRAFTEREIVLGVDFSPMYETESGRLRGTLAGVADGLPASPLEPATDTVGFGPSFDG